MFYISVKLKKMVYRHKINGKLYKLLDGSSQAGIYAEVDENFKQVKKTSKFSRQPYDVKAIILNFQNLELV